MRTSVKYKTVLLLAVLFILITVQPAFAIGTIDNLSAERSPNGSVTLTWTGGVEGQNAAVLRAEDGGDYIRIAEVPQADGRYTDWLADSGTTYSYKLSYECIDPWTGRTTIMTTNSVTVAPAGGAPARPDSTQGGGISGSEGGMLEKAIAGVINGIVLIFQHLEESLSLKTFDTLVFNRGLSEQDKEMAPFSAAEWDRLNVWYRGITLGVGPMVLIAILVTAVKFMKQGINPQSRTDAIESAWRWVLAVVLIAAAPILFHVMFALNNGLVDTIQEVGSGVAMSVDSLNQIRPGQGKFITDIDVKSALGAALIKLMLCGLELQINLLYLVRKYTLMAIYVFTPIMAWLWAVNKNINAMGIWFGELLSNSFMQTAHALVFMLFLTFADAQGTGWLELVIWLMVIIPIAEVLRNSVQGLFTRLSGMDEGGLVMKAMGVFGLGSVAGLGRLASTAVPSKPSVPLQPGAAAGGGGGINLSGIPVASPVNMYSMPAGTGAGVAPARSAGVQAPGTVPAGGAPAFSGSFTTTPSGLMVPASALGSVGAGSAGAGSGEGRARPPGGGLQQVARTAGVIGSVAAAGAGTLASVMFAPVPGGEKAVQFAQRAAGGAARAGAVSLGTLYEAHKTRKEQDMSWGEALSSVTGAGSPAGGIARTAASAVTEGFAPVASPLVTQRFTPSMDDYRWR